MLFSSFYIFTFFLNLRLFKKKNYIFIQLKNKNYVLIFRLNGPNTCVTVCGSYLYFNIKPSPVELNELVVYKNLFCNLIKQFCVYSFSKIRFLGKGYKIKKISKNSFVFVFNRAHLTLLFFKNNFFKKIKKRKILIKYLGYNISNKLQIVLKEVRKVSTYTRRGLRISRQVIYKRRGKRT